MIIIFVHICVVYSVAEYSVCFKGCGEGGSVAKLYVGGTPRNATEHDVN